MCECRRDQMVQLSDPAAAGKIRGDGESGLAAQCVFDESGQVAARSDVDEEPQAIGMHCLDGFAERHRLSPLRDGQVANRVGRAGHARARRARIYRDPGTTEIHLFKELGDGADDRAEARRMIGARKGQLLKQNTLEA